MLAYGSTNATRNERKAMAGRMKLERKGRGGGREPSQVKLTCRDTGKTNWRALYVPKEE